MQHIYVARGFEPEMIADADIYAAIEETCRILSEGVDNAIKREVPQELIDHLHDSTFLFSGFKTYHEAREVSARLLDTETGTFKTFDKFYEEVRSIHERYNQNYLRAEYNFAVQSTQMAVRWHKFEQDGDRYLLQYRTANDGLVRPEHQALHNTTLPIGDPFWNDYTPPLGWNCRCTVVQVRRGKYPESDSAAAIRAGEEATAKPKLQIFRFNPGKTLSVFPPKHPYFKAPRKVKQLLDPVEKRVQKMVKELPSNLTEEQKQAIAKHNIELENQLGIAKGKRMTMDEADKQSANPHRGKEKGYSINCQTCAPAYALRIHGFNVTAKSNKKGTKLDYLSRGYNVWEAWKNTDGTKAKHYATIDWMAAKGYKLMNPQRYRDFFEETCKDTGIYELSIGWKGSGGHATILQRLEDGRLLYIEPQHDNSKDRSLDYLCKNGEGKPHGCRGIMRIDDKLFNTDFIEIFDK